MKQVGKVISDILSVVCFILVVAFLFLLASGIKPYIVLSGSMEPAIHTGSLCMINEKVSYEQVGKGDVIAFQQGKMRVTHRVLRVHSNGLETKGDANRVSDGITTTKDNYIGKAVFSIPYVGYVFQYMHTRTAMILFVTIFCAAPIIAALFHEIKLKEKSI